MSKRKSYDVSFKLKAVECAEKKSKLAAAREMGVDGKQIRQWCKQKAELAGLKKKGTSSRKRQRGAGRSQRQLFSNDWGPDCLVHVVSSNDALFLDRTRRAQTMTGGHVAPTMIHILYWEQC